MKATHSLLLVLLFTIITNLVYSQNVGIGVSNPDPSSVLEISSKTKGVLIPRLAAADRNSITAPSKGLMVFDSTENAFYYFNGNAWKSFKAGLLLEDADGNTRVQVEKNPDENLLRVDLAGKERMVLYPGRMEFPNNDSNIYIGYLNGFTNTFGIRNTGIGNEALRQNQTGSLNTAVGFQALKLNNSGSWNTAIGTNSMYTNIYGSGNVALGGESMYSNITGNSNIAVGPSTLFSNTTGDLNVAIGNQSLYSNTQGKNNVAIGVASLLYNTNTNHLVAIGDSALFNNGTGASSPSQSINNVAIGSRALKGNSTGHENTGIGTMALLNNTTGSHNTALGYNSMRSNLSGFWNTAIGEGALNVNTSGGTNTSIGFNSLQANISGNGNTTIGYLAGKTNTNGSSNIAIGNNADFGASNLFNAAAIGSNAVVNNNNAIVLGNLARVGIGESSPTSALTVKNFTGSDATVTFKGTQYSSVFHTDPVTENVIVQSGKAGNHVILNPVPGGKINLGGFGQNNVTEAYGKMFGIANNGSGINIIPLGVIYYDIWCADDATSDGGAFENVVGNFVQSLDVVSSGGAGVGDPFLRGSFMLDQAVCNQYSKIIAVGSPNFKCTGTFSNALIYNLTSRILVDQSGNQVYIASMAVDNFPNVGRNELTGNVIFYGVR